MKTTRSLQAAAILLVAVLAVPVQAHIITLSDLNTSSLIDVHSQAGMFDWYVDGENQIAQQWFWFRVGNTPEASIDTLPLFGHVATDTNPFVDPSADTLSTRFGTGTTFWLDVTYTLRGGAAGSATADMGELITVTNNSGSPLDFHFFQYSDFNLGDTPGGDTVARLNPNTVLVTGDATLFTETVVTPSPEHYELDFFPTNRNKLNDGLASTLADGAILVGPGDVTWAFQWDRLIAPGTTFGISKDKNFQPAAVIPEPSTPLLFVIGLALLGRVSRTLST